MNLSRDERITYRGGGWKRFSGGDSIRIMVKKAISKSRKLNLETVEPTMINFQYGAVSVIDWLWDHALKYFYGLGNAEVEIEAMRTLTLSVGADFLNEIVTWANRAGADLRKPLEFSWGSYHNPDGSMGYIMKFEKGRFRKR